MASPNRSLTLLAAIAALAVAGCSMQRLAVDRIGDALAADSAAYAGDDDPEMVGAAAPFGLKLMDSLLAESPRHRGLLLAAARGYTQYAWAWVEQPADLAEANDLAAAQAGRTRARKLYLRARDYGIAGLALGHPGFAAQLQADPAAAAATVGPKDVALLYWTAAAWGAAIALGKDDPALLAGLPQVEALAGRALELDEAWGSGSLHVLHISLAMSRPGPVRAREAAARAHFERALVLSDGRQAAPYVTYAEAVGIPAGRADAFAAALAQALAIDPGATPESRLANVLFQRRARWLSANAAQYFPLAAEKEAAR